MPRIPTYERQVAPAGAMRMPQAQGVRASGDIGQGLANIGRGLENVALTQIQQENERIAGEDALVSANALSKADLYWQEELTRRQQGWSVGGEDLRPGIQKDFDAWVSTEAEKLRDPRVKQQFKLRALDMQNRLQSQAFTFQERATTDKMVSDFEAGTNADIDAVYRDPTRRAEILTRRLEALAVQNRIPEGRRLEIGAKIRDQFNLAAERGELERDPEGYYTRRFGSFSMGVEPTPSSPGRAGTVDAGRVWSQIIRQESGGRQFGRDGQPLTSSAGAIGVAQVMPGTAPEAARLAGVPFDEQRYRTDPAYNEKLGRAYFGEMLRQFDGDFLKAVAAYNAGPGNGRDGRGVRGAIQRATRDGKPDEWVSYLPAETRNYVTTIAGRLGLAGGGRGFVVGDAGQPGTERTAAMPVVKVTAPPDRGPDSFESLPYEQREKLRDMAEGAIRQRNTVAAQALEVRLRDSAAMARDGIVDPKPLRAEDFAPLGAKAPAAFEQYQRDQTMASDVATLNGRTNAELAAVASGAARRAVPGEGYAAEDQRDQIRAQAAAAVLKRREDDPAAYVMSTVPSVQKAAQAAASGDPAATQAAVAESLAAQTRLGVQVPRVLSRGQIESLSRTIETAKPQDAADVIAQIEQQYGRQHFPAVMQELMRAEKLPQAYMIIPNLPSQGARELVARVAAVKLDDLKAGVDRAAVKDTADAVREQVISFARTIPATSRNNATLMQAYSDTAEKIALQFVQQGMKAGDAAEKAGKLLFGHYEFADTLRVPQGVDASQARRALSRRLADDTGFDVPPDLTNARTPEQARSEWEATVRGRAVWYTAPDDSGASLWAQGANGVLYRVTRGGQPVVYTWDSLRPAPGTVDPTQPHNRARDAQRAAREASRQRIEETRRQMGQ